MSVAHEIDALELSQAELKKAMHSGKTSMENALKVVKRATDKIAADQNALNVAVSNLRHMRGPADHVVLAEYAEVCAIALQKKEAINKARKDRANAQSLVNQIERQMPVLEAALAAGVIQLAGYGELLGFPSPEVVDP